jgi:hypothetical protein
MIENRKAEKAEKSYQSKFILDHREGRRALTI